MSWGEFKHKFSYACVLSIFMTTILLLSGCSTKSNDKVLSDNMIVGSDHVNDSDNVVEVKYDKPSNETLINNDFIVYFVNCGAVKIDEVADSDILGLYQSTSDKEYGIDLTTGMNWGYQPKSYMVFDGDLSSVNKMDTKWIISDDVQYNLEETGFYYDFDLPHGEYEITVGFYNPFSYRTVDVISEGEKIIKEKGIYKYRLIEESYTQYVTDGELNLFVYNPNRGNDAMKNPIVSYIIIRVIPEYNNENLQLLVNKVKLTEAEKMYYALSTTTNLDNAIKEAEELLRGSSKATEKIKLAYINVKEMSEMLKKIDIYDSFKPGEKWNDTEGNLIQAHGGHVQLLSILNDATGELEEIWWWVGEDKTLGYRGGICAYSSEDLYNWKFEGVVMRNITSREQLAEDEYFTNLYAGYTKEQLDNVYRCINDSTSVIERPKMIYNEKTKQYVMWFHADGPTETSNANYAAASAGVAVSDSPRGPFKFIDRYRLHTCPPEQEDMFPRSKGMARDMNLFVDDDNTAYIIYSSEENLTMYISRLNDDYTYLDKSQEEAVHGKDYIRIFPGAQREAPAVFKKDGIYYMMTSGATGWNPNQARYAVSDSIFGDWINMGDPCIDDIKLTTFDSQSTCIFYVGGEVDKYIYMGDRWNSNELGDSRYIWLPLEFDDKGIMRLLWQNEWVFKE